MTQTFLALELLISLGQRKQLLLRVFLLDTVSF